MKAVLLFVVALLLKGGITLLRRVWVSAFRVPKVIKDTTGEDPLSCLVADGIYQSFLGSEVRSAWIEAPMDNAIA